MNSTTSISPIEKLQQLLAVHGLHKTIVTDDGSSFTSTVFKEFLDNNSIRHITSSSPYQPSTKGLAERTVQSFKNALRKIQGGSLQSWLT